MFTVFMDMCSGGDVKIDGAEWIIIEASKDEAIDYFIQHFGRNPYNVTCECCGDDYSIHEEKTLEECFNGYAVLGKTLVIMKKEIVK